MTLRAIAIALWSRSDHADRPPLCDPHWMRRAERLDDMHRIVATRRARRARLSGEPAGSQGLGSQNGAQPHSNVSSVGSLTGVRSFHTDWGNL